MSSLSGLGGFSENSSSLNSKPKSNVKNVSDIDGLERTFARQIQNYFRKSGSVILPLSENSEGINPLESNGRPGTGQLNNILNREEIASLKQYLNFIK